MGGRCPESIPMERGKGARWGPARPGTWGALGTEGAGPPRPDPALRGGIGPARDKTLRRQQERGPAPPPSHIPTAHPSKTPPARRAPLTPGRRTDPAPQRGSRRVCRRSWCSRRNTPQQTEPQEVPAQVWAPWATEHPRGSPGSSEEPGLSWVLLKRELWGGGQPLPRSYHKHSTSQPPPASEHPGDRATAAVLGTGVWGTAGSFPVPVPQRLPSAPARPSLPHFRALPNL